MRLGGILSLAWWNMRRRRLRTVLTMVGVIIGVAAIVALSSLGNGLEHAMRTKMEQGFEIDVLPVMAGGMLSGGSGEFIDSDVEMLRGIPGITAVSPVIQKTGIVPYASDGRSNSTACVLLAVDFEEFIRIYPERISFEAGELPGNTDGNFAIIGHGVQHPGGGTDLGEPGEEFNIQVTVVRENEMLVENHSFTLSATLQLRGATDFINFDNAVFIPIGPVGEIYGSTSADLIMVKIGDPEDSKLISSQIEEAFAPRDVRVLVPTTFMEQIDSLLAMLDRFHLTISSVALLVAGVGIMNIMTVSVMERIRDIGVMKAIGARNRTVLSIFLTEASLIGTAAALAGVPIGLGIAHLLSGFLFNFTLIPQEELLTGISPPPFSITPLPTLPWVLGAVFVGIGVSVIFGWYPARKAAMLDPVEAIRYE